jgi:tetratricopeptide (TPR) repeat protein
MRKLIGITLIITWTSLFAEGKAQSPDSLYFMANNLYEEGKYEDAIDLYQGILDQGYESSTLYFNLGNACFRSNKIGKSRLYYEKALKLDPGNTDAEANLIYLENLLVDKFEDIPELFLKRWIQSLVKLLNSNSWGWISLIAFITAFVFFSVYLLVKRIAVRKAGFYAGSVLCIISILSFLFSWKQRNLELYPESAVVIEYLVNVKSAPRETGTDLFVLHEGSKVWLEDMAAGWREIRLSDGRKGWVPLTVLGEI